MVRVLVCLSVAAVCLLPCTEAFVQRALVSSNTITSRVQHVHQRSLSLSPIRAAFPRPSRIAMSTASATVAASPSVKAPPDMYQNAVNVGEKKAAAPAGKILTMGVISGCHIAMGALLAITVGGNCPGLASTNPGLQKIIFGAFGRSTTVFPDTSHNSAVCLA